MNFSNINYNLYKCFIAVYENKNISRAAKELFITQPNLSRSIKELEKYLDIKLFSSHPRGMEPTNAGTELYNRVAPAFAWVDLGEKNIKEFNEKSVGVIRIVSVTNFGGYLLSQHIKQFNVKYPYIQFEFITRKVDDAIEMLERRKVDIVLGAFQNSKDIEFKSFNLYNLTETYFASCQYAKEKSIKKIITEEQFNELPLISHGLQELEKKPNIIVDSQEMMYQLVIKGLGVGRCIKQFLDSSHSLDPIFRFKIQGAKMKELTLDCSYREDLLSKATKAFIDELKSIRT